MSILGVYFGPKEIDMVETKGRKLLNHIQIPLPEISGGEFEDKVPLEIKIVALFNDALRRHKIECKEAVLSLSGKDLIIRTFEMPNLPKDEMASAVNFEAKKYIPFKIEELISGYQTEIDKTSRVNTVLFAGIKKETLNKYFSIFNQLNIKTKHIEYSGFSIIKALKLGGIKETGVVGLLCVDPGQDDEVNFVVLENGFPLFNRDISLNVGSAEGLENIEVQAPVSLDKLKTEMRVSLDYYQRKFPGKNIQKMFVFVNEEQYPQLEAFMADLGIATKFIDFAKIIGKPIAYSAGFIKGYSAALENTVLTKVKINLVETRTRLLKAPVVAGRQLDTGSLLRGIKIDFRMVTVGILICLSVLGYGIYQAAPFNQKLREVINNRIKVEKIDEGLSLDKLEGINSAYESKLNQLDALVRGQLYLTETLDVIPRFIPEGVWLISFLLNNRERERIELSLEGKAYLRDSDQEFEAVNKFLESLKQDPTFTKHFTNINILSINRQQEDNVTVTNFSLSCKNYQEGK
jgi:Tfp pilus assembly PilM family ATPase/Tfp pilus assembly protein PilN